MSTATVARPARRTSDLALVAHQIRYEQLTFWRNRQGAFFTFLFPVMIFVIFGALFGNHKSAFYGHISSLQYYAPVIAALSVIGACYSQLAIVLAERRQSGILKRVRATPLPAWAYFLGLLAHCVIISVIDVALIVGLSIGYGVTLPGPGQWLPFLVALVVGVVCFCALGVGVASLVTNSEAAPAVVQVILFPLLFISGTYFPINAGFVNNIADIFPVRPFNQALIGPFAYGTGFDGQHLAVVAVWGAIGSFIAVRRFRWDPRPE